MVWLMKTLQSTPFGGGGCTGVLFVIFAALVWGGVVERVGGQAVNSNDWTSAFSEKPLIVNEHAVTHGSLSGPGLVGAIGPISTLIVPKLPVGVLEALFPFPPLPFPLLPLPPLPVLLVPPFPALDG